MKRDTLTTRDGFVVGLIAYAAVAIFYAAFDFLASRGPLYTVDLLGKAVFRGVRDPAILQFPLDMDAAAIFSYNALHLLLSLAIGIFVTSLIARAERRPDQAPLIFALVAAGFVVTVFVVQWLTEPMRQLLPWWSIVVANGLATLCAGWYLVTRRPALRQRLGFLTARA